ncbi:hypothetical protein ACFLSJ_03470 [Verrucomicrobiota bacterium]
MNQTQTYCYLSTQEHIHSFIGRFIYIYTDKGEVSLTTDHVRFTGKSGIPIEIPVVAIKDIQVGHYSRWAKPFRLDYIKVRFQDEERERTVLLTPTRSWAMPTWETNKIVSKWVELLRDAQTRHA